jgi:hypothetical protein
MGYFVIGPNGELYGPADIATLNQWIAEGRLQPTTMLQEELGGARFAASMLAELNFGANYPRGATASTLEAGAAELKMAWIFGAVGFLCCSFLTPVGLVYAILSKKKGNPKASVAIFVCALLCLLSIAWTIFYYQMGGMEGLLRRLR